MLTPSVAPLHSTGFHLKETSPSFSQRGSPKPVQLSLTDALKLPGGSNHVRKEGASLVTMLVRQEMQGAAPDAKQQDTLSQKNVSDERLRDVAQIFADKFR